jgi:hypothetical protein
MDIQSNIFYLALKNSTGRNIGPYYMNYGNTQYQYTETNTLAPGPSGNSYWVIGYYPALSSTVLRFCYQGSSTCFIKRQGFEFTLPFTISQSLFYDITGGEQSDLPWRSPPNASAVLNAKEQTLNFNIRGSTRSECDTSLRSNDAIEFPYALQLIR